LIFKESLKQAEDGPQIPQGDLVKMAFKLFNNQDEA
jgi:hypothetical protein